jgi:hypothetical protein
MRRAALTLALLLALPACNQIIGLPEVHQDPPGPDGGTGEPPDAAPPPIDAREDQVIGFGTQHWVLEDSRESVPLEFGAPASLELWLFDTGQPDGYDERTAAEATAGSFAFEDIPAAARYMIRFEGVTSTRPFFVEGEHRSLDFSVYINGHRDPMLATTNGTTLQFDITNMQTYDARSLLTMGAWGVRAFLWLNYTLAANLPVTGDTEINDLSVNWFRHSVRALPLGLLDGDVVQVAHLVPAVSTNGAEYLRLEQFFESDPVTMQDSESTLVAGAFEDVVLDRSLVVEYRRSAFFPHREAMGRELTPYSPRFDHEVYIDTLPWGLPTDLDYNLAAGASDLVVVAGMPTGDDDISLGTLTFADPYNGGQGLILFGGMNAVRFYRVPGWPSQTVFLTQINAAVPIEGPGIVVEPVVTPPLIPTVDGVDFTGDVTISISSSPAPIHVAWDPPAVGTPTHHQLTLIEIQLEGTTLRRVTRADLVTDDNDLDLPRNLFEAGAFYFFHLRAVRNPNIDATRTPFLQRLPEHSGGVLSGLVTVQP